MTYKIKLNGKIKAKVKTSNDAFIWLQKHQPFSYSHATKYEGWKVEKSKAKKGLITYDRETGREEKDKFYTEKEEVYNELMKHKSFRESTPRTKEEKLKRALAYRRRKR